MPDPILTLGDLEPERHYVNIRRNAPAGPWQRFKYRHLDLLLRWFPVRFETTESQYQMRRPSEFGMRNLARLRRWATEAAELVGDDSPRASVALVDVLDRYCKLILDAPGDVIEGLDLTDKIALAQTFQQTVMGQTPTDPASENPSTSAASSPVSTVSTAPETG